MAREKMWARIYLIPLLQAEEDRDQVRRYWADKAREKELLGTDTRVYHSERWVGGFFFFFVLLLFWGKGGGEKEGGRAGWLTTFLGLCGRRIRLLRNELRRRK